MKYRARYNAENGRYELCKKGLVSEQWEAFAFFESEEAARTRLHQIRDNPSYVIEEVEVDTKKGVY